jgi:hypothetical protein
MGMQEEKDALWKDYFELVLAQEHRRAFDCLQQLSDLDPDDTRVHSELSALMIELGEVPLGVDEEDDLDVELDDITLVSLDTMASIFAWLPREDLNLLEQSGTYHTYGSGDVIFNEGDMGESMYIIKSGKALVTVKSKDEPLVVATLGDGDFFGEMALVSRRPRTATVTALAELMVLEIPREGLRQVIERHPSMTSVLAEFFNTRAMDSRRKLEADEGLPE